MSPSSIVARPATLWPPPAHGDLEARWSGELDGVDDIGDAAAAGDHGRTLVHEPVVHFACVLVCEVERLKQLAAERGRELIERRSDCHGNPPCEKVDVLPSPTPYSAGPPRLDNAVAGHIPTRVLVAIRTTSARIPCKTLGRPGPLSR